MCDFQLHNISGSPCVILYIDKSNNINNVHKISSDIIESDIDSLAYFNAWDERNIKQYIQEAYYIVIYIVDTDKYLILPDIKCNTHIYIADNKLLVPYE